MTDKQPIYAELPQSTGEHHYGGGIYTEAQLRLYADATHALRTQAHAAQAPVTDLQNVHDAVTVDLLNERVAYLEAKLKEAQAPQQVAPTRATISEMVPFVDKSTADPVEKARRYLTAMGDNHLHSTYFFDDGFPKQESASDALATLAILEQLAAPQQEVQEPVTLYPGCSRWGFKGDTAQPAPSGDVSKSGEESNMSDAELLDFICDNDRQRMVEQSGGFWRVYQDEAPLEAEHHLWQSMTSRWYSTAREAISAARKEGKR